MALGFSMRPLVDRDMHCGHFKCGRKAIWYHLRELAPFGAFYRVDKAPSGLSDESVLRPCVSGVLRLA